MAKMTIEQILEAGGAIKTVTDDGQPDPVLTITPTEALKLGDHTFQLQVSDDAGNDSVPIKVVVTVIDTGRPNARVVVLDEQGKPLSDNQVPRNTSFVLNAEKSFDPDGGAISSYVWHYVGSNI